MDSRTPLFVLLGVAVAFVVALALFGSGTETVAQSTTSTFADLDIPDPPLTTTTLPRAVEVVPDVHVIEDVGATALLGLERLIAVVGQSPTGHRLLVIDHPTADVLEIPLHPVAADFALDASGTVLSYLGGDTAPDTRWVVPVDGSSEPVPLDDAAGSFVWSGDEPLTAAWLEASAAGQRLMLGEYTPDGMSVLEQIRWADGRLAGFNSSGMWTYTAQQALSRATVVEFTSRQDGEGWGTVADLAITPATGTRALLARLDVSSWSWNFGLGAGDLRPLSWAPGDASGDKHFAALSPTGVQVAFIGSGEQRDLGWLEIHSTVGGTARRLALPYRVWDVRWSQRADHVVMPGTDHEGTHVVILVDTGITSTTRLPRVHAIEMDDWVQFATVVDTPRQTASDSGPVGN